MRNVLIVVFILTLMFSMSSAVQASYLKGDYDVDKGWFSAEIYVELIEGDYITLDARAELLTINFLFTEGYFKEPLPLRQEIDVILGIRPVDKWTINTIVGSVFYTNNSGFTPRVNSEHLKVGLKYDF